ncbi:LysR family transcriptional regulator [Slackia piriformis]|uniref:LysR family transcriptional regulator n=1 Tax=Slackia piriformis TaxID=626934 RepID=UPI0026DAFA4B|nr:LysR family transcriptional regulator [Slackia piriformis]MDO5023322.1 LysR family transcriptional regulator [Slackia piriformis]
MKTGHMREFITLSQSGGFREAARKLYISQPALSNHIKAIEEEVGCLLIDRENGNGLTAEGLVFLDAAQSALMTIDCAIEECRRVHSIRGEKNEPARVQVHTMFIEARQALSRLCERPYEFVLYEWSRPLLHRFVNNEADVMVTYDANEHRMLKAEADGLGLTCETLGVDFCSVAMKSDNPLAAGPLTKESLKHAKFVILSASEFGYWKAIISRMFDEGHETDIRFMPVNSMVNMEIVDLQDSVLLCMSKMVHQFFGMRDDCVVFDLLDGQPIAIKTGLVYRPNVDNENVEAALSALRLGLAADSPDAVR